MENRLQREGRWSSALPHARTQSLDPGFSGRPSTASTCKMEINYSKLRELCTRFTPNERFDHQDFMREYPSIFLRTPSRPTSRPHTYHGARTSVSIKDKPVDAKQNTPSAPALYDIRSALKKIHGTSKQEQAQINLSAQLNTILNVVKKLPIQRSRLDARLLAQQLMDLMQFIFQDKSIAQEDFFMGLAKRAILETIPAAGYSLPRGGGFYLLLRGEVEKLSRDEATKEETSIMLYPGDSFGQVEREPAHLVRSIYPTYTSTEACMLLRINAFDYTRAIQVCKKNYIEERRKLMNSCAVFYAVSPSIVSRLAEAISWEKVDPDTVIVREGQSIDKVYIIQEGTCKAMVKVPDTLKSLEITVGELHPGDCIGEVLLLKGRETHSYTITTTTHTRLGCVTHNIIKATEVQKHILSNRRLSLPSLTSVEIRDRYVKRSMHQQWTRIKEHVMEEVATERGIQFGIKKWQHSISSQK